MEMMEEVTNTSHEMVNVVNLRKGRVIDNDEFTQLILSKDMEFTTVLLLFTVVLI